MSNDVTDAEHRPTRVYIHWQIGVYRRVYGSGNERLSTYNHLVFHGRKRNSGPEKQEVDAQGKVDASYEADAKREE